MSRPIGSICCDHTVEVLEVIKTDEKTGQPVADHSLGDLFQCDSCGAVSKECLS